MKMLMIVYSGSRPQRITSLLDQRERVHVATLPTESFF
jgi:hypothetical protein